MLPHSRKDLGAYYTPDPVARFLTQWAVRSRPDTVLDPSAGDGVFLRAAAERVASLGGNVGAQVRGVELFEEAHRKAQAGFAHLPDAPQVVRGDFFDQSADEFGQFSAVIGNPPFIRFHRFKGAQRAKASARSAAVGIQLSGLASSWAPFLIHATTFVRANGRLAVVAPAELAHASYARPVLSYLCSSFEEVHLIAFEQKLFPDLSEDTVLILAAGRGRSAPAISVHKLRHVDDLDGFHLPPAADPSKVDRMRAAGSDVARFIEYFLEPPARALYREISQSAHACRLSDLAGVSIGYVTGNNDFFHLTQAAAAGYRIPDRLLHVAVRSGRDVVGLAFTPHDGERLLRASGHNLLLRLDVGDGRIAGVREYLALGRRHGVADGYKCRNREPWYRVPNVYVGDAFVTYMNGTRSRFFINQADAVAPNTLHVVRFYERSLSTARMIASSWPSTLTSLSCEIEGHALGGGMLKLEPRECGRVIVPKLSVGESLFQEFDALARAGHHDELTARADRLVMDAMGLSKRDHALLAGAVAGLRARRMRKS